MMVLQTPATFLERIGTVLGPTDWRSISQSEISNFAKLTGDDHWIHVDIERAAREQPDGRTLVHGIYILSLIPKWQRQLFHITNRGAGLSYGYDRTRFILPVEVDAPIRLSQTVIKAVPHSLGTKVWLNSTIEIEEPEQVAVVAQAILLIADK